MFARIALPLLLLPLVVPAGAQFQPVPSPEAESLKVEVLAKFPHDRTAFTQGLEFCDGELLESTGLTGKSSVRRVDPASGQVLDIVALPAAHFGEGLTVVDDRILQITWQNGVAHVYDVRTLEKRGEFRYEGEGWGLCYDGTRLIMTDGSPNLTFRDPYTFEVIGKQGIIHNGRPLKWVNELEYAGGFLYGNIWRTNEIARIDPKTGHVTAIVDASGLLSEEEKAGTDVLNGIAWNPETETFMITGKLWPAMFEVRFIDPQAERPAPENPPAAEDGRSSPEESPGPTEAEPEPSRESAQASSDRSE